MADNYVYAVARIRSLETALFTESVIGQLLACKTYESALDFLAEKGWGDSDTGRDAGRMLKRETEKTWEVIRDLKVDPSALEVLSYSHLYHNLKAAVKEVCAGKANAEIYYDDTFISGETMREILQEKDASGQGRTALRYHCGPRRAGCHRTGRQKVRRGSDPCVCRGFCCDSGYQDRHPRGTDRKEPGVSGTGAGSMQVGECVRADDGGAVRCGGSLRGAGSGRISGGGGRLERIRLRL